MHEPFGTFAPLGFDRAILAATARLPVNWIGRRLSILLRRFVTMRLARDGAIDVERWGLQMRLHPKDNGCEKNLLFTPQMFEPMELGALARALQSRPATFVDIGANVGLWSLYAMSVAPHATIVAIEPEPGNLERLKFNLSCNPGHAIRVVEAAVGAANGQTGVIVHPRDRGGTKTVPLDHHSDAVVPCLTLLDVVSQQGLSSVEALKIDVEGVEDDILVPFFARAPAELWPRVMIIEDASVNWSCDLFALLRERGYVEQARTRANVVLRRSA